jgi:hypothetical protein
MVFLAFGCAIAKDKEKLQLKSGERKLFIYNTDYIYPVLSPSGKIETDEFPKNHQHALMFELSM